MKSPRLLEPKLDHLLALLMPSLPQAAPSAVMCSRCCRSQSRAAECMPSCQCTVLRTGVLRDSISCFE